MARTRRKKPKEQLTEQLTKPQEQPVMEQPQGGEPEKKITQAHVREALTTLKKYREGKALLETRVVENEQWWKLRHWDVIDGKGPVRDSAKFESAWLFNMLLNKHADAMDNYPEPVILPREEQDRQDAQELSEIMPVVMEMNGMEEVYDAAWWAKLKYGTGVYGVFWDTQKENGLGDIQIRKIDLLNIFWEPGVEDIQKSANLFVIDLWDKKRLEGRYPQAKDVQPGKSFTISQYLHEDHVDTEDKVLVVDWYYKVEDENGKVRLHYVKFANDILLYATENDESMAEGLYAHGQYPFVFDVMFPMEGSPAGFGYIDVAKKPQMIIDSLNEIITTNAWMAGRKRFFVKEGAQINADEFADWSKPFVHVVGNLGEESIREFSVSAVPSFIQAFLADKVNELKETSGNRDVAQGGTTAGATAASAIAAMQEAAGKLSRDMIRKGYRAMVRVATLVLELIRQFYTEPRYFRITGDDGQERFMIYQNAGMQNRQVKGLGERATQRRPVYDIQVKAQRASPYSTMSQNELIKELYGMGMFNPQMADQALMVLDAMQFEGKESIIQKVRENGGMYQQIQMLTQQMQKMAAVIDAQNGTAIGAGMAQEGGQEAGMATPRASAGTRDRTGSLAEQARQRTAQSTKPT